MTTLAPPREKPAATRLQEMAEEAEQMAEFAEHLVYAYRKLVAQIRASLTDTIPVEAGCLPVTGDKTRDLSRREREIMASICRGLRNADIAREFFVTEKTVKNHVNHIYGKLCVRNRAEAIAIWLGLATP